MRAIQLRAVGILVCGLGVAACSTGAQEENSNGPAASPGGSSSVGGSGGGLGTGGSGTAALGGPGRVVMHRLNITEYNNTVRDLLQTELRLSPNFPPDDTAYGFDNVASALSMTDVSMGYYVATAKQLAAEMLSPAKRSGFLSCDVASGKETCVSTVLNALLPKAWRRPVEAEEVTRLVTLYTTNKADGASDDEALGRVFQAVLLAPSFLFRVEPNSGVGAVRPLDGYELASRLSYFLWSSMPDADLTAAAASGALADDGGLSAQVARLLADERAAVLASNFGSQWLSIRGLDNVRPDAVEYPSFDAALQSAMREETMHFFADIAAGKRALGELLTTTSGYVNDRLAQHYGMPAVGSTVPVLTPMPPERGGLLMQASILTVKAHPQESAPVLRGQWILNQLLCQDLPPPPADVPQEPPAVEGKSRKERLASHRIEQTCKTCHDMMDPLGLALENYDGIGQYRTMESGVPVDPSGTLADGRSFQTPQQLAALIAADPALPRCLAKHVFTYGLGRALRTDSGFDAAVLETATQSFSSAGQLLPKLIEAVVMSDVFRKREDEAAQ